MFRHTFAVLLLAGLAAPAGATGFFVNQQSVGGLGRVGAGSAAAADELGTIFFNPAGLTQVFRDGRSQTRVAAGGLHVILPRGELTNAGSVAATPGTLGMAAPYAPAGEEGTSSDPGYVPNLYWAQALAGGRAAVGLGLNFPFGLTTTFSSGWFGRYDAIEAALKTVNLSAVGAWRFDSGVSIGGGIDFQYANSRLVTAIPNPLNPGGPTAATDGRAETKGHDWSPGFNIGILAPLGDATHVGAHYRSGIRHDIEGSTLVTGLAGPLAPFNGSVGAKADLDLPAIATVAVRHGVNARLQLLANVDWFDWSSFKEVRVRFANGNPDVVRTANYRDTYAVAAGAEYRISEAWQARGGIRYDRTPTVNGFRDVTVPDSDRVWLGLGATWRSGPRSAWDFAFNHVFFRDTDVAVRRDFFPGTPLASTVDVHARVKSVVNTLSIGFRHAY